MTTHTPPALTPKQQKVADLVSAEVPVAEIAKRLKISTSGVYGHIRNIRALGVELDAADGETPVAAPPPVALANGAPGDPAAALQSAIHAGSRELAEIDSERDSLQARIAVLAQTRVDTEARLAKYQTALDALS